MEVEIKTFEDLIQFVEENDLSEEKINEILMATIQSLYTGDTGNKSEMIKTLKEFWEKWSDKPERPLFIDLEVPEAEHD